MGSHIIPRLFGHRKIETTGAFLQLNGAAVPVKNNLNGLGRLFLGKKGVPNTKATGIVAAHGAETEPGHQDNQQQNKPKTNNLKGICPLIAPTKATQRIQGFLGVGSFRVMAGISILLVHVTNHKPNQ